MKNIQFIMAILLISLFSINGHSDNYEKYMKLYLKQEKYELAFALAASHRELATVEKLLEGGVNVDANRGYNYTTALQSAAIGGSFELAHLLFRFGADPNATDLKGRTALHYAAMVGTREFIFYLLEKGADPKQEDSKGRIALDFAKINGREALFDLLTPPPVVEEVSTDIPLNPTTDDQCTAVNGREAVVDLLTPPSVVEEASADIPLILNPTTDDQCTAGK